MTSLNIDQLKECFESATRFLAVAEDLSQSLDGIVSGNMYPCVVNGAFACELFLKTIIGASDPNGVTKSHKNKELFSALNQKTRESIEAEYLKNSDFPLDDLLDELDNAFIVWRYAYEQEVRSHYIALIALGKALKKIAQRLLEQKG